MPYSPLSDILNQIPTKEMGVTTPISILYTPPKKEVVYQLPTRGARITDSDIEAFKPLLYGEISNRDFTKKQLEGDVIFNTVLNRQKEYAKKGQYRTISEILAMPNQYKAYGGLQYTNYFNPPDPLALAKKQQVDMIVDRIRDKIKKGDFVDNTEGAYYYMHEKDGKIKYDNLKKLFAE